MSQKNTATKIKKMTFNTIYIFIRKKSNISYSYKQNELHENKTISLEGVDRLIAMVPPIWQADLF